jgi:MFS transporter, DHA1 family, multidrug resistance protein
MVKFNVYAVYLAAWVLATSTVPLASSLSLHFDATIYQIQLLASVTLFLFSASQFFVGPISDAVGRRPVLLSSLVATAFGLIVCLASDSFDVYAAGLLFMGIGAGPMAVVPRAIAKDLYDGDELFKVFSTISFVWISAIVLASVIASLAMRFGSWRFSYAIYVGYVGLLFLDVLLKHPETHPIAARRPWSTRNFARSYFKVFSNRGYLKYNYVWTTIFSGLVGGIFTYIPIALRRHHYTPDKISLFMLGVMVCCAFGSLSLRALLRRFRDRKINRMSLTLAMLVTGYLWVVVSFGPQQIWPIMIGFGLFGFCSSSISSVCISNAMLEIKDNSVSGYAAALIGISASFGSAAVSGVMSATGAHQRLALLVMLSVFTVSSSVMIFRPLKLS